MHNLVGVIKFEILKQIRKPIFWIAIFAMPLAMLFFGGVSYLGAKTAIQEDKNSELKLKQQIETLILVDHSRLIDLKLFGDLKLKVLDSDRAVLEELRQNPNKKQAAIIYPTDLKQEAIRTYVRIDQDPVLAKQVNNGVANLAQTIVKMSASHKVEAKVLEALSGQLRIDGQIMNQNGQTYNPLQKAILPGIFVAVFFLALVITGNQSLVATTEEKENRIAEMLLTSVSAKTLIVAKIIALTTLGFIQILSLLVPALIIYLTGVKLGIAPAFLVDLLKGASFDFLPVFFGAGFLIFGVLLVTGITILIGSLFPTAQDASQFLAPVILPIMAPLYFSSAIATSAHNLIVVFLSYFPLTAPITLLIRNASSNLRPDEAWLGLAVLIISSLLVMRLAVRSFQRSIFIYQKPSSLKDIWRQAR